MSKSDWWNKRVLRSVDNLKFWQNNPRLDPAEEHVRLNDFVEDLISVDSEKNSFLDLIKSIASKGFMPIDPVVVWQHENGQYIVAEGNRRVLALKLLRNPEKSPKAIRAIVSKQAAMIDRNDIEKIYVCCAPSFKDSRWYVLQRHSTSSTQRTWQRLQQQNFILQLYDEVDQNIDLLIAETGFDRSEVIQALRYVEVRNIATRPEILSQMTEDEAAWVKSYRMNMTVLERWFGSKEIREKWGIEFDGMVVNITSNIKSFYNAYAQFLKLMYLGKECGLGFAINTRSIPEQNQKILAVLPEVTFTDEGITTTDESTPDSSSSTSTSSETSSSETSTATPEDTSEAPNKPDGHRYNPDRNQLVHAFCSITVSSAKLKAIFREFKILPIDRYKNVTAASLRVFLELSVDEYTFQNDLQSKMSTLDKDGYNRLTLQRKLSYLNDKTSPLGQGAKKVISKLLNHTNEHSLDTLNSYIHGMETHKTSRRFINGFWDILTPLFSELIEFKEK
ncbi:hypothetical protein CBX96_03955 [Shewanella sp. BC20]|uniref:ParB N-terminal domain-containing protein n=1 Tax=Shewanella sp. BC20 TaxID=2004459 RepID=UPI000D64DE26|nr:ParB N-terminal domain-containing protein [Shewanella sp. BC20]PWF64926.1 hypothetical protein CBX96_03955 [Shewanella sp. BC20]